ncbi:murein hydrolase activator EnvC family protein [Flavobacterium sp. RHBU_24]|uniref:murein hydrolase activator EnvC family protein n=1 Tax=Flavobacterium sp. RHBU_24 TaxID=3391185 RepID=UPI003984AD40
MKNLLLTFFLLGFVATLQAQGGAEQRKLEARKKELVREMKALNALLKDEGSKEKTVEAKISENDARIKLTEKIISTTQKQTRLLTDNIYLNQLKINKLNRELKVLKEDYAKTLLHAYKSRSDQSRIMFILSSKNFLEAYKRVQYMKQYASFRKVQGDELRDKMTELETLLTTLEAQKKEKVVILAQNQKDKRALENDREEQTRLKKTIQKNKKKYLAEINDKERENRQIDRKIEAVIQAAIAEANRKAAAEAAAKKASEAGSSTASSSKPAKSTSSSSTATASAPAAGKIALTKEGKIVSDNFKANKGRLPWPVEKGYISSSFGTHPSPLDSSVTIRNSGIEITTEEGAAIKAVFGGEVSQIIDLGGGKRGVLVLHGDFLTIYSNLSAISVSPGDKVSAGQRIGTVGRDYDGRSVLKFIVSQNSKLQDPAAWLAR